MNIHQLPPMNLNYGYQQGGVGQQPAHPAFLIPAADLPSTDSSSGSSSGSSASVTDETASTQASEVEPTKGKKRGREGEEEADIPAAKRAKMDRNRESAKKSRDKKKIVFETLENEHRNFSSFFDTVSTFFTAHTGGRQVEVEPTSVAHLSPYVQHIVQDDKRNKLQKMFAALIEENQKQRQLIQQFQSENNHLKQQNIELNQAQNYAQQRILDLEAAASIPSFGAGEFSNLDFLV